MTSKDEFWNEPRFKLAAAGGGAVLFLLLLLFGFGHDLYLPRKPPRPKAESQQAFSERIDRTEGAWRGYAEQDAHTFGIHEFDVADLTKAFDYRSADPNRMLDVGDHIEGAGLRLELGVQGKPPKEMLVLTIKNQTRHPLAYRVDTMPSRGTQSCRDKRDLVQNAIGVGPGETVERTECVYRKGLKLKIKKIETLDLPLLSFDYVSKLPPAQVGYDNRVSAGHRFPQSTACTVIFDGTMQQDIDSGAIPWRDVIDFYARHTCETYTFPRGYTHFERDGERPLPAAGARR